MQKNYLILAVALLLVIAGCSKAATLPEAPERPDVAEEDVSEGVYGSIYELNSLDEDVQVEELEINPDELSGLDF